MTAMTFCHGLYELMDSYDGFIVDQWGVLHDGVEAYDGAVAALNHLRQRKKQLIILSNSAKRADENIERLRRLGIKHTLYKAVVTAGEVTWQGLREQKDAPFKGIGKKCYLISRPNDKALLQGLDIEVVSNIEDASFILMTGFDSKNQRLEDLDPIFKRAVVKKIPALCANPDIVTVHGQERGVGPGAIAQRYHELGGSTHLIGKPNKTIFRYCLHLFEGIIPSRVLVLGDSIQHDIAGGMGVDLDTAFITSGIHANAFQGNMSLEQKRKAMEHLCQSYGGIRPTWVMDRLIWQTPEAAIRERERARMKE